jgi:glycosyltransferase involved in cell wall biosynthesis
MHAGESSNAHHLCRHLAGQGHEIHVLTSAGNNGAGDTGIKVHPIMRTWSWLETFRFARFVRQCAPDAVLLVYLDAIYNYHPMITFSATLVRRLMPRAQFVTRYESPVGGADPRTTLLARLGRKIVASVLGGKDINYNAGSLLRDSDHVIALCEGHRELLARESPQVRTKAVVIPPPPNIVVSSKTAQDARLRGRALLGVSGEEFVIAFFGYVYPKKGIETLLEAFRILSHDGRKARLVLIGGTLDVDSGVSGRYWDEMQQLCKALGIADRTLWTGAFRSDREEGSLYLRAADVCVLPLLNGVQLNNSSFSAMAAHGMPIITTRGPATDRVFADGENVLFFEARNAPALAERLKFLMDSAPARERLRAGVGALAREWLSWDTGIRRTLATLS